MIKSVVQLKNIKMPFAIEHVLTMRVDLPHDRYPDDAARVRFFEALQPRLAAEAGVDAATLSDGLPAAGNGAVPVQIQGVSYMQDSDYPVVREGIVTSGYFETYEVTPLRGRGFQPSDTKTSQGVAIVNDSFARQYFPGVDPVGRLMKRGARDSKEPWLTIVGLVPDMLMQGIGNNTASPSGYYIPISQSNVGGSVRIALRSPRDVGDTAVLARAALAGLDPDLPAYEVLTMDQVVRRETWFYVVFGTFFTGFGVSALILAAAGLYGVMSFAVTQRTREMGVRSALGAQGTQLVRLIMRRSVIQLAIGLTLGLALGLLASGPLSIVLYRVNPRDPAVVVVVLIALALTSLVATALPAWRVTKIDPLVALNTE
jgi:predicted permease